MKDFRSLDVWSRSHQYTLALYTCSQTFPDSERFGLTQQIRRAAASVPTNLAEGCGRGTDADFARFVQMAMGSASEVEYQLVLAHDLGYLDASAGSELAGEITGVKKMLAGLLRRLRRPTADSRPPPHPSQ